MDLRQLECFAAVAETGSFTRAGERIHASQPAVSARVAGLERELGQSLFDRSGRSVRLTAVGAAVLPHAVEALAAVRSLRRAVDEHAGLLRGTVTVGMVASSALSFDLPRLLVGFRNDHPDLAVVLTESSSDHLVASLRDGRLDVAVIASLTTAPGDIEGAVVADEPLVAAVAPDDPLAGLDAVPLRMLAGRPLVTFPASVDARATLEAACRSEGFEATVAFEASDPSVLAAIAAAGHGVGILPRPVAQSHGDGLRALAIEAPSLRGSLALAWRVGGPTDPAARMLVERLRAAITV